MGLPPSFIKEVCTILNSNHVYSSSSATVPSSFDSRNNRSNNCMNNGICHDNSQSSSNGNKNGCSSNSNGTSSSSRKSIAYSSNRSNSIQSNIINSNQSNTRTNNSSDSSSRLVHSSDNNSNNLKIDFETIGRARKNEECNIGKLDYAILMQLCKITG
jgi:hypothetical protein